MTLETTVGRISETLDGWFPRRVAATWDNTGLLVGTKQSKVQKVLLCLTVTREVGQEAADWGADLLVSHHPVMFKPIQRLTGDSHEGAILLGLCQNGVAVYSPHTAHDGCVGGINDQLAKILELELVRPLFQSGGSRLVKIVTFVPESHLVAVSQALFNAGGGNIGNYSGCSFMTAGTGTFVGGEGTNPTIGEPGKPESVPEIRLEVVFDPGKIQDAISGLRSAHPYEEPAFDIVVLEKPPAGEGDGRIGRLKKPSTIYQLSQKLSVALPVEMVQAVGDPGLQAQTIAIGCGAAGEWVREAKAQHAHLFVTGEMRYHEMLWTHQAGMGAIILGHHASESFAMTTIGARLAGAFPDIQVRVASSDHVPNHWFGKTEKFTSVL